MSSLHGDVASAIGQQVEQMILQAKKDSEARVRHDLSVARSQLQHMEGLIQDLSERVQRAARANGPGVPDPAQTVDRTFLNQKISQLEQKWGSEVKALKQDLHRTILAHNHNSDLMRHHRDALDEARRKLDGQMQPKAEQVDAQINKVDAMLRQGQAKQRAIDALTERLTALEAQVGDLFPNPAGAYPGMMPGMPGMPGMLGQPPGMGPPGRETQPSAKRASKKEGGEPPTEEEVLQHMKALSLQKAAKAGQASSADTTTFNAEAPVFVPRGAASPSEAASGAAAGTPMKLGGGDAAVEASGDAAEPMKLGGGDPAGAATVTVEGMEGGDADGGTTGAAAAGESTGADEGADATGGASAEVGVPPVAEESVAKPES